MFDKAISRREMLALLGSGLVNTMFGQSLSPGLGIFA